MYTNPHTAKMMADREKAQEKEFKEIRDQQRKNDAAQIPWPKESYGDDDPTENSTWGN